MGNSFGFGLPPNMEVEHESYCERLGKSICGVFVGIALFFGTIILLGWNEFNYVRNQEVILYTQKNAVKVGCTSDAANLGKAVYTSCKVASLYDFSQDSRVNQLGSLFVEGSASAAWIDTSSQIYQWTESKSCSERSDGHGGKKKTCTYHYRKDWVSTPINSNDFHCVQTSSCYQSGEQIHNTGTIPQELKQRLNAPADRVAIGTEYGLNSDMISQLSAATSLPVKTGGMYGQRTVVGMGNGRVQFAKIPGRTMIGDVQTSFQKSDVVIGDTLSAVAKQGTNSYHSQGASFTPWDTGKSGTMETVNWLYQGAHSLNEMCKMKADENNGITWVLRFVGWLLMFVGLQLITGPIALVPQAVPCIGELIGDVVGCALCCVNCMVSLSFSLVVIAVAWLLARPLYGAILLGIAVALIAAAFFARSKLKSNSARSPTMVNPLMPQDVEQSMPVVAPAPMAMQQAAPRQVSVLVPDGCGPGQVLQVQSPDGGMLQVTVPQGVGPGGYFTAQY